MNLAKLAPAGPLQPGPRRRWTIAASVLLHMAGFALLLSIAARRPPRFEQAAPSYDLVFEGPVPDQPAQSAPPAAADVPAPDDALPGPPAPPPSSPPQPDGVASTEAQAAPSSQAELQAPPAPPPAQPAVPPDATPAAPQLAFAEPTNPEAPPPPPAPLEIIPSPAPPTVRLAVPREETQPEQHSEIMPRPPPPLPPMPAPPRPRPPRAAPGTFANPMDLAFGPSPSAPRPAARGSVASRAINTAIGTPRLAPDPTDPGFAMIARAANADWGQALLAYWVSHRYYPRQAVENGDQGTVLLEMTVDRFGHVESVEVKERSGSQWLDMAALGTFRGAHLPPLPATEARDRVTFPVSVTYTLVRG